MSHNLWVPRMAKDGPAQACPGDRAFPQLRVYQAACRSPLSPGPVGAAQTQDKGWGAAAAGLVVLPREPWLGGLRRPGPPHTHEEAQRGS